MAHLGSNRFRPDAGRHAVYEELYREYVRLHDAFGRSEDSVMKRLKAIQRRATEAASSS
jgi:L-ribulokinase